MVGLKGYPCARPPREKRSDRSVVPAHVKTIREWPETVLRTHAIESPGAPNLQKAISRVPTGTQSYADVASRKHMCASTSRAVLLWMTFAIMSRGEDAPIADKGVFGVVGEGELLESTK